MKKIILIMFAVLLVLPLTAQEKVAGPEVITKFLKTKTCVVLDDNIFNAYNDEIKKAVVNSWTITPYEFIAMSEFEKRKFDPQYSFLVRTKDTYSADSDMMSYTFLSLLLGGKYGSVYHMPTLCSFPLSYYNVDYDKYVYQLGAIVKFVQGHVELTKSDPSLTEKNIIRYYNSHTAALSNKTFYVIPEEMATDVNTEAEIKAVYSKPFKLSDSDEIQTLIEDKDTESVFLHKVGPPKGSPKAARCFNIVMGCDDGTIYYVDFHKIGSKAPDGFLKSDFKALNKQ